MYLVYKTLSTREISNKKVFCNSSYPIESQIQEAKADIETLKINLEIAQKRKLQKMEYDQLARSIKKHATREKSLKCVLLVTDLVIRHAARLNEEIRKLELQSELYTQTKEYRKSRVEALVLSMHAFQDEMLQEHARADQALQDRLAEVTETGGVLDDEEGAEEGTFFFQFLTSKT